MVACHNTADTQAINLLTLWGQFDRGLMLSVTEWNLFIIPNVMVSSLRAFFSSLSISVSLPRVPLIPNLQHGSVRQHFPYFLHLYPSSSLIHVWFSCSASCPGPLAFIIHPPSFISLLWLITSSFTLFLPDYLSLSLGCSYIHHHIFSFSAQLSFIPSAISKRISQKLSRTNLSHISPQNPDAINATLLTSARLGH